MQKSGLRYWSGFLPLISVVDMTLFQGNGLQTLGLGSYRVTLIKIGTRALRPICCVIRESVSYSCKHLLMPAAGAGKTFLTSILLSTNVIRVLLRSTISNVQFS